MNSAPNERAPERTRSRTNARRCSRHDRSRMFLTVSRDLVQRDSTIWISARRAWAATDGARLEELEVRQPWPERSDARSGAIAIHPRRRGIRR